MAYNELEELFAVHLREAGIPFERQYEFAKEELGRKWAADFWLVDSPILIEIEGGTYTGGKHVRGPGFEKDAEKHAAAARLHYTVIRFTSKQIKTSMSEELNMDTIALETAKEAYRWWGPGGKFNDYRWSKPGGEFYD